MQPHSSSTEDTLTRALVRLLKDTEFRRVFWNLAAPARLRHLEPPEPIAFKCLKTSKPDMLFQGSTPLLYVEAKLGAQTEPMQLTRARAWMRFHRCRDDQIILLTDYRDQLPFEIGWRGPAVPIRTIGWREVHAALQKASKSRFAASAACQEFERILENSSKNSTKTKLGLRSTFGHPYGEVMQEFASRHNITSGEFIYGSGIDPRLTFCFPQWKKVFGRSPERLWLFYGREGGRQENYRAQMILWHNSDFYESKAPISKHWDIWRKAILQEPGAIFVSGLRPHSRRTSGVPGVSCPSEPVGLINHPARLNEASIRRWSRDELVDQLVCLVAPFERIVRRVLDDW